MIRVLIVDDEPPARRKVRRFLEGDPELGEIREAGSGGEAIAAIPSFARIWFSGCADARYGWFAVLTECLTTRLSRGLSDRRTGITP